MRSKFKHHFAVFFLMVFAINLSEATLHGLLHCEMNEVHAHHACGHGVDVDTAAGDLPLADGSNFITEHVQVDTCMLCTHFLAHDHVDLTSTACKLATLFADLPMSAVCELYRSCTSGPPLLRGPPTA